MRFGNADLRRDENVFASGERIDVPANREQPLVKVGSDANQDASCPELPTRFGHIVVQLPMATQREVHPQRLKKLLSIRRFRKHVGDDLAPTYLFTGFVGVVFKRRMPCEGLAKPR